jgi:peptidoglycan/LPS O-acetylase OafA/YrhL
LNNNRLIYLDSLRGIAAFSVVIYHIICSHWDYLPISKYSYFIFNGADAVSLFFVLSGLVLSKKYIDSPILLDDINFIKFIKSRVFRIMPAYIVVILIMYFYIHRWELKNISFYKELFLNKNHILEQLILVRGWLDKILTPAWTLAIELLISFLIPILLTIKLKNKTMFYFLIPFVLFANKYYISIFLFHFLLGIILASNYNIIQNIKFKNNRTVKLLIFILSLFLFSVRQILNFYIPPIFVQNLCNDFLFLDTFFITGLGSFGIIWSCISSKTLQVLLSNKLLHKLGVLSYSIYLTHCLFISIFLDHWAKVNGKIGPLNMFVCMIIFVLFFTFMSAYLLNKLIEIPFIKYGKQNKA